MPAKRKLIPISKAPKHVQNAMRTAKRQLTGSSWSMSIYPDGKPAIHVDRDHVKGGQRFVAEYRKKKYVSFKRSKRRK